MGIVNGRRRARWDLNFPHAPTTDLRDHRNATFEPPREVLVEQLRASGPGVCKLGALVDIPLSRPKWNSASMFPENRCTLPDPDVVAIGYLAVQQSSKTTRPSNWLLKAAVACPHAVTGR